MNREMKCPYPCGWKELNKIVTGNAAYFARATLDDDIPEEVRQAGIYLGRLALELVRRCRYIPDGYALVPVEPNALMIRASSEFKTRRSIYKAMIAAAKEND